MKSPLHAHFGNDERFDILFRSGPRRTTEELARIMADSICDLGDVDACVTALSEAGVSPWEVDLGTLTTIRVRAHNIRTERLILRRAAGFTACMAIVLAAFAADTTEAHAADMVMVGEHLKRGLEVVLLVCILGVAGAAVSEYFRRQG